MQGEQSVTAAAVGGLFHVKHGFPLRSGSKDCAVNTTCMVTLRLLLMRLGCLEFP